MARMHKPSTALLVAVAAAAMFMEMFDGTVILTALPAMAASFGVSPVAMSIGITGYLLALAAVLPTCSWVADRFGTRRVFMLAVTVFALASIACGLSNSLLTFTLARVVQGAAGALMSPVARIALLKVLDRHMMVSAVNVGIMAGLVGPAIGPPLGGFIATYSSWRWIFYINVPIAILGLLAVYKRYPDLRGAQQRPFDWRGAGLNAAAMVGVIYGLQLLADGRQSWQWGAVVIAAGAVSAVMAWRHLQHSAQPLLSLAPLRIPTFRISALAGFLSRMAVFSPMFVLPLQLQLGLGMSAFAAGGYILIAAAADILAKLRVVHSLRRFGHRRVLVISALLYGAFPLSLIFISPGTPAAVLVLLMICGGLARSYQMTAISTLSFADVPREASSSASAVISIVQQVAQAVGVALAAVAISVAVSLRSAPGAAVELSDFRPALLLSALGAWLALRWYLSMAADAGSKASGFVPRSAA
jgi:EmrB/QacA subfamily drug resistance transporter